MSRIRMLKPGTFTNEKLAEFGPWHRLLFMGLWGLCDRAGRLEDRPRRIYAEVFPYDERLDVNAMLDDLASGDDPFIVRYQVSGKRYLWLPTFLKHQRPHFSEPQSTIPAFSGAISKTAEYSVAAAEFSVVATEISVAATNNSIAKEIKLKGIKEDQDQRARAPDLHRVLVKIAHDVLTDVESGTLQTSDAKDELKHRAAKARLYGYDATAVTKALDSAQVQRARL